MGTEIVVGLIAGVVGIVTAIIGLMGKMAESTADKTKALLDSYSARVDKLESRQSELESKLDDVRSELRAQLLHNSRFRRALSGALEWIGDAVAWMNGPRDTPPPGEPDTDEWRELLKAVE